MEPINQIGNLDFLKIAGASGLCSYLVWFITARQDKQMAQLVEAVNALTLVCKSLEEKHTETARLWGVVERLLDRDVALRIGREDPTKE